MAVLENTFNIPTVDISPYLKGPSSAESRKIIGQVHEACSTTGFFQLIGHGISPKLQASVLKGSAAFFSLPYEQKIKLDKNLGAANHGYEIIGTQALEEGKFPDLKEGFYIGQDIPTDDPRAKAHPDFMGPNLWPDTLPDHVFKEPTTKYYEEMFQLSLAVMDILARALPYGDGVFRDFISNTAVASIRLLHYPPQVSKDKNQLGAGAHTDFGGFCVDIFGAITLLLQDDNPGLQVFNPKNDEWVPITPNPAAYVVNVGDMLCKWTNGFYKSSLHRVLNNSPNDRYSVPFFFDGNMDCRLDPFDGSGIAEGDAQTVEEHMLERFRTTYGRVAKVEGDAR